MPSVMQEPTSILFTGATPGVSSGSSHHTGLAASAHNLGYHICQDFSEDPDLVVCVNYKKKYKKLIRKAKTLGVPTVLVKQEPPTVIPEHRQANPGNLFDKVVTVGVANNEPMFKVEVSWDTRFISRSDRQNNIVAISADKWSFYSRELYSLRREVYSTDSRVDLYGNGWRQSNWKRVIRLTKELLIVLRSGCLPKLANLKLAFRAPKNYLGAIEDKKDILSRYRVSLVIENDDSAMSEKLVDCILSGTIPVYVGPEVSAFGIPDDIVVQSEPNLDSVIKSMTLALELDPISFRKRALAWASLESSKNNWDSKKIGEELVNNLVVSLLHQSGY